MLTYLNLTVTMGGTPISPFYRWGNWGTEKTRVCQSLSCVRLFVTQQVPLSMGFSRHKYWSEKTRGSCLKAQRWRWDWWPCFLSLHPRREVPWSTPVSIVCRYKTSQPERWKASTILLCSWVLRIGVQTEQSRAGLSLLGPWLGRHYSWG